MQRTSGNYPKKGFLMTLYQFNVLPDPQKIALLWAEGLFVTNKPGTSILLYQLFDFYIELHYEGKENKAEKLRSFSNISQLEPYLKEIDISSVTNIL